MKVEFPVAPDPDRVRVLRVIARMNLGGPAHHVSILSGRLDPDRYQTLLVTGGVGPGEESAEHLAARHGASLLKVPSLAPQISPRSDLSALRAVRHIVQRFQPHIVHTHTAKAGLIGRVAALTASPSPPSIVHTYHGHVLRGYFGRGQTTLYRALERALAFRSDRLLAVSTATVDELVELGIAPRSRFEVVPLGLDLDPFLGSRPTPTSEEVRREAGVRPGDVLIGLVGRLVPIKRPDLALRAVALARATGAPIRLAVIGDGDLRPDLERLAADFQIDDAVTFLGYRRDMVAVANACDAAMLSSANEGTPVWLIEAGAAGRPLVATAVGGVRDVVADGCGIVVPPDDEQALAAALRQIVDPRVRAAMGLVARDHIVSRYSISRLLEDVADLYERLLSEALSSDR